MTVSEYIFNFLEKRGCKQVFMVSGSSAMWLTDALKRNEKLEAICCQHEQVAAMAADGSGRVSKVPGVCLVTIGPGATNAITGVAGAYLDSSPMFVLSGQANSRILEYQIKSGIRQKGTQSLNLESMVKDITKYFAVVMDEGDIRYHMEAAYEAATCGRKGPVWLDIPIDIQNKKVPEKMKGYESYNKNLAEINQRTLTDVVRKLETAEKPLILAGNGVLGANAKEEVLSFAKRHQIPIVTSRNGIGVIGSDDPLFIGRPGSYGDRASHFAVQESDFILILGSRLSVSTIGYYPQRFGACAYKVMVDIDEKELDKEDVPIDVKIQADIKKFIQVLSRYEIRHRPHEKWLAHCQENKKAYPNVQAEYRNEIPLNSYYFTEQLSQLVPDGVSVVVDTGSVCNIVSQSWFLKKNQNYIISGGLSCMGFWASAIGIAASGKNVVALSGDGSTQMNIQDFATMAYYKLPLKLFVYNNKGYMLIRHNQHNYMNDRFLGVGPDSGVPSVDFVRLAKAYDLKSVKIEREEEIRKKVQEVLEVDGPVVCEVMVQEFGTIAPRIASKVMPDGSLKAAEFDDLWPFLEEKNVN